MAGWPPATDGTSRDVLEILGKLQSVGFCGDLDISVENLSSIFNRILSLFFKEICQFRDARPLPALLGDGRPVDLLALYRAVREKGGYDSVTSNRLWETVAEEAGVDSKAASSLKLIHVKYLEVLDRWIQTVLDKKADGDRAVLKEEMHAFETKVNSLPDEVSDHKKDEVRACSKRDHFLTPVKENGHKLELGDDDVMVLESVPMDEVPPSSVKRKREQLVGMLNWVRQLAKNPGDPFIRKSLADLAKGRAHAVGVLFSRALLAREAIFLKKIHFTNPRGPIVQKEQKIHLSCCDDYSSNDSQGDMKRRCSRRHSVDRQQHSQPQSPVVPNGGADHGPIASGEEVNHGHRRPANSSLLMDLVAGIQCKRQAHNAVRVGPNFQAEVPEWTGMVSEISNDNDSLKWLGSRIWPPEKQKHRSSLEWITIKKGHQDLSCLCQCPGSVDCIRFHVAEERLQLKWELGPAFHHWRFDRMGEEFALSWTEDEEQMFKAIVRRNSSSEEENFWEELHSCFPSKGRQNLVNYYFNVYVLRRRSYQNRVTENNIDSDDEESEFGFLSNPLGHNAVKFRDPKSIFCAQNKQCIDLDGSSDIE